MEKTISATEAVRKFSEERGSIDIEWGLIMAMEKQQRGL